MSDPIEFKFINDSLTTIPQARLVSKLASYFKIPQKHMREALDKDRLKYNSIVSFVGNFEQYECSFDEEFYVSASRININDFIDPKRFHKSKLVNDYNLIMSNPHSV